MTVWQHLPNSWGGYDLKLAADMPFGGLADNVAAKDPLWGLSHRRPVLHEALDLVCAELDLTDGYRWDLAEHAFNRREGLRSTVEDQAEVLRGMARDWWPDLTAA